MSPTFQVLRIVIVHLQHEKFWRVVRPQTETYFFRIEVRLERECLVVKLDAVYCSGTRSLNDSYCKQQ